ncbi:MAG: GNAT family N-acetyltransferase, partial [Porticoccaceae bacterium]|nr:GNAT family N-acetyltransferase [Porticoccaceae bacterium]
VRGSQPLLKEQAIKIIDEVIAIAEETDASSWHLLFPSEDQMASFEDPRLLTRLGVQYHWHNDNYQNFDDYLLTMTSRKRKMIKKERADIIKQNIDINVLTGVQIDAETWALFYRLYERTYAKRNGTRGYLTRNFFEQIAKEMPDQIAMAVAYIDDDTIACALYFFDDQTLYGRYWGSIDEFPFLHFELCYYQGIEFAIRKGLSRYDAGAQGEHKLVRGFRPKITHSMHWIQNVQFRDAIERFVTEEAHAVEQHIYQATKMLPFKQ